jgi:DNA (cytosine-5)-methyltransferase 1
LAAKRKKKSNSPVIRCVDLFAGAGGFSLAAIKQGIKVVAAVEMKAAASATYRANLATKYGVELHESDITAVDPGDIAAAHFTPKRGCDIVLGGPPCQGFSVHRINGAGVKDPRNELILRYFDFVSALKSKVFLMENVPGILWDRHKDFIDAFYAAAKASGYRVFDPITVDARDYGVPQRRKRVFILGVREDIEIGIEWPPKPTHAASPVTAKGKAKIKAWIPASAVFARSASAKDPNNIHMQHSADLIKVFKSTPANGGSRRDSNRVLDCHLEHSGHTDVYGRIDPHSPGPTMTTACVNPSKGRFVHPTEHHGITVRQAARFQTFPDWFKFHGGLMASGEQVGNAVPVKLGEALLAEIKRALIASRRKSLRARGR